MDKSISYKFPYMLLGNPYAVAHMKGGDAAANIKGSVKLYPADGGTLVAAEIFNLPQTVPPAAGVAPIGPFGFHLHDGTKCDMPFADQPFPGSDGHYNPAGAMHPEHAGDFPVLFSNNGYAYMVFYTDRFKPADVLGKTIVIHQNPDDFRTQPAGNSGKKIACGVITKE